MKEGDDGGSFPVGRVLREEHFDLLVVLVGELEWGGIVVALLRTVGEVPGREAEEVFMHQTLTQSRQHVININYNQTTQDSRPI